MIQWVCCRGSFQYRKEFPIGKYIKGKKLPRGISRRKDYDTHLYKLCDEAGIKRFCMHALRHTYAARAIESRMQPKTLQKLLGHSSLKMTMDRYVHVTDDSMEMGIRLFEQGQLEKGLVTT